MSDTRTTVFSTRWNERELALLRERAALTGMTGGQYVRHAVALALARCAWCQARPSDHDHQCGDCREARASGTPQPEPVRAPETDDWADLELEAALTGE